MPTSPRLTSMALAVLDLLHEEPMHPYEMRQTMIARRTDRVIKLRAGTLYHTVERLARQGLIESVETSRAGRRPERTVYTITEAGRESFAAQVVDMLANPAEEYPEYAFAMSLAGELTREAVLHELDRRRNELRRRIDGDRETLERMQRMDLPGRCYLDLHYLDTMQQAELEWTGWVYDEIESGRMPWGDEPDLRRAH